MKRGGKRSRRTKTGGGFGEMISKALVPFSILGLQQTYRKKRRGGRSRSHPRRTRRH
jgi:hypothetical protein